MLGGPEGPPIFLRCMMKEKSATLNLKLNNKLCTFLQMHFLKIQFFKFWGKGPLGL